MDGYIRDVWGGGVVDDVAYKLYVKGVRGDRLWEGRNSKFLLSLISPFACDSVLSRFSFFFEKLMSRKIYF